METTMPVTRTRFHWEVSHGDTNWYVTLEMILW